MDLRQIISRTRDNEFSWTKTLTLAAATGGLSLALLGAVESPRLWDRATLAKAEWIKAGHRPSPWAWLGWKWAAAGASLAGVFPLSIVGSGLLALLLRVNQVAPGHVPPARAYFVVAFPLATFFVALGLLLTLLAQTFRHLVGTGFRALRREAAL